jgi:hypothetical protein
LASAALRKKDIETLGLDVQKAVRSLMVIFDHHRTPLGDDLLTLA